MMEGHHGFEIGVGKAALEERGLRHLRLRRWTTTASCGSRRWEWLRAAQRCNPRVKMMLEQPRDPIEWMGIQDGQAEVPSFLSWEEDAQVL